MNYSNILLRSAIVILALSVSALAKEPKRVEYSFRWNPKISGPASIDKLNILLETSVVPVANFRVHYYKVPSSDEQAEQTIIFRERKFDNGENDYRLKFRSFHPYSKMGICPNEMRSSYEKDITFLSSDSTRDAYSISCSSSSSSVMKTLKVTPLGCQVSVNRFESQSLRIEHWKTSIGESIYEISSKAKNTSHSKQSFAEKVARIIKAGAIPISMSKTAISENCNEIN